MRYFVIAIPAALPTAPMRYWDGGGWSENLHDAALYQRDALTHGLSQISHRPVIILETVW